MKIASVYIPRTAQTLIVSDFIIVTGVVASDMVIFRDLPMGWAANLAVTDVLKLGSLFCLVMLFILTCNFAMGLYQRRFMRGRRLVQSVLLSAGIGLVALLGIDNLYLGNSLSFDELASLVLVMYLLMAITRPLICGIYENIVPKRRFALVGSSGMADRIRCAIDSVTPADVVLVDHYDVDVSAEEEALGATLQTARNNPNVDEVFVEMSAMKLAKFETFGGNRPVKSTLSLFDSYMRWTDNELMHVAETEALIADGHSGFWIKRLLEAFVCLFVLVFFLPVVLGAMIAIKLEDGGSLFYKQTRVGKNGKLFSVLKFRSMIEDAEKVGRAQWAKVGDSRVTRVGAFLRKSRIDELPQLLNVIKGDMALVGPRPERPEFVEKLSKEIKNFDLRHVVRPGLTGWAQISYPYGASVEDARWKTRFDLYYINNWTIWFDIAIIFQTIRVVLLAEGAR